MGQVGGAANPDLVLQVRSRTEVCTSLADALAQSADNDTVDESVLSGGRSEGGDTPLPSTQGPGHADNDLGIEDIEAAKGAIDDVTRMGGLGQGQRHEAEEEEDGAGVVCELFQPESLGLLATARRLLVSATFWRFCLFSLLLSSLNWIITSDSLEPTYMLRCFGPDYPRGLIFAINPLIIVWLTPIVSGHHNLLLSLHLEYDVSSPVLQPPPPSTLTLR